MTPQKRIGIVILGNRGNEPATRIGRQIMLALARSNVAATDEATTATEHAASAAVGLRSRPQRTRR